MSTGQSPKQCQTQGRARRACRKGGRRVSLSNYTAVDPCAPAEEREGATLTSASPRRRRRPRRPRGSNPAPVAHEATGPLYRQRSIDRRNADAKKGRSAYAEKELKKSAEQSIRRRRVRLSRAARARRTTSWWERCVGRAASGLLRPARFPGANSGSPLEDGIAIFHSPHWESGPISL